MAIVTRYGCDLKLDQLLQSVADQLGDQLPSSVSFRKRTSTALYAHSFNNRIGSSVFAFLRTIVMNLLRRAGYISIRQGLRLLAYDKR